MKDEEKRRAREFHVAPITGQAILAALTGGELTEAVVIDALRVARKRRHEAELAEAQNKIGVGARVTIGKIRPARLEGTVGTVERLNGTLTRADIKVESTFDWQREKGSTVHGIPLVCLTIAAKEKKEDKR
jgi:hypothetical protein